MEPEDESVLVISGGIWGVLLGPEFPSDEDLLPGAQTKALPVVARHRRPSPNDFSGLRMVRQCRWGQVRRVLGCELICAYAQICIKSISVSSDQH